MGDAMKTTLDEEARPRAAVDFDDVLRALSRAPSMRPADIDLVGRTVGRFVVKRRLGEGGMGIVYEALDPVLGRPVALKVLRASQRDSGATRARLHEEARRVAALHHPHIATVYDAGEHEGIVFLALERAAGQSLRARLATPPALGLPRTLAILRAIASGLACAHDAGIVHRDLKPENVVVGDDGTVKIIDFGIAAASGQPGASSQNARPAGTKRYMAPEHAAGAPASARADVFAFGVLARELLAATVVPPRDRSTRAALTRAIGRCTAVDPAERPADGAALLAAIDAIASPPRDTTRATLAAMFGAAAVAAVVGVTVARSTPAPSRQEAASSDDERPAARPGARAVPRDRAAALDAAGPSAQPARGARAAEPALENDDPREDADPLASPTSSGGEASRLLAAGLRRDGRRLLGRDRRYVVADESPAGFDVADGAPPLPVTAFVDDRGRLVATVRLEGYGARSSPLARKLSATERLTGLQPIAAFDSGTTEAEVVSDGDGGAVIHLKLHLRASGTTSATGHDSGGKTAGKWPPTATRGSGSPSSSHPGILLPEAQPQLDLGGPIGKPDPGHGGPVPLHVKSAPSDIQISFAPDGALILTLADGAIARKLLVIVNDEGDVTILDEEDATSHGEHGTPAMHG